MTLLYADYLKKHFKVEGYFYHVELLSQRYEMRGMARILRNECENSKSDALIIMTNPGNCSPADKSYVSLPFNENLDERDWQLTNPDRTQYQLMNLMERKNWNRLDIINLSDICNGNLKEFRKKLSVIKENVFHDHTLFSDARKHELNTICSETPLIIKAWGTNTAIKSLALISLNYLNKHNTPKTGLKHKVHPYYLHPRQQLATNQIKWLDNFMALKPEIN